MNCERPVLFPDRFCCCCFEGWATNIIACLEQQVCEYECLFRLRKAKRVLGKLLSVLELEGNRLLNSSPGENVLKRAFCKGSQGEKRKLCEIQRGYKIGPCHTGRGGRPLKLSAILLYCTTRGQRSRSVRRIYRALCRAEN